MAQADYAFPGLVDAALACEGLGCVTPIPTAAQVMVARKKFA